MKYVNYSLHKKCCCLITQSCLTLGDQWTVTRQTPLSMGFQSKNTGVGCYFLLQGIFWTQAMNLHLLHLQAGS